MPGAMKGMEKRLAKAEELLDEALRYIADLNGCKWITGDGPGEIDMRGRASILHHKLSDFVFRK